MTIEFVILRKVIKEIISYIKTTDCDAKISEY